MTATVPTADTSDTKPSGKPFGKPSGKPGKPDKPKAAADHPQFYRAAEVAMDFLPIEREGKLYIVKLKDKLVVQTPVLTLTTPLVDDEGDPLPFATLAVPSQFGAFARRVEALVLDACVANKAEWFRKDLDDDALRTGFKTFLRPNGTLKIKVPEDAAVFDADKRPIAPGDVAAGTQVRAIIELSRISFGKTEFGAMWRLVQARAVATPECLIEDVADDVDPDDVDFL